MTWAGLVCRAARQNWSGWIAGDCALSPRDPVDAVRMTALSFMPNCWTGLPNTIRRRRSSGAVQLLEQTRWNRADAAHVFFPLDDAGLVGLLLTLATAQPARNAAGGGISFSSYHDGCSAPTSHGSGNLLSADCGNWPQRMLRATASAFAGESWRGAGDGFAALPAVAGRHLERKLENGRGAGAAGSEGESSETVSVNHPRLT